MDNLEQIGEILMEADGYGVRNEVIEISSILQEEGDLSPLEATQEAFNVVIDNV